MAFNSDLRLRDLTPAEMIMVAGDKRIIAIQHARAVVERQRAYVEDAVREFAKKNNVRPSHERINVIVNEVLEKIRHDDDRK